MKFSDRSDMIWLALVPGLLHFLSFDFNYFLISGFPSWSAKGWLGWSSGVAFVVARGWLSWSSGGGFRGRQGGGCRGRRGWLSWSPGVAFVVVEGVAFVVLGRVLATQPDTHRNVCRISTGPKKTPKSKKNRGFFGKGFLFSVVISPLKKSPPLF